MDKKIFKYLSRLFDVLSPSQIKNMELYSYTIRYGITPGQIFSGLWGKIINCYTVYHKLAKHINTQEKKDLLIHTLNGNSMFSEHPTHHVFCNIYLYFSHSKSDETIIRTIPKCQVSKWSESSNVFFLLWQFPLLL